MRPLSGYCYKRLRIVQAYHCRGCCLSPELSSNPLLDWGEGVASES
ncbi:hypothetical protein [Calycomorphotria hydatis]|nr:hypothetical protein [Calycomorphotria hydatis]